MALAITTATVIVSTTTIISTMTAIMALKKAVTHIATLQQCLR
jgi:hypothetical protein